MTKFTMTRIETEDLERLRLHAKNNRRSMIQQLGQFIPPVTETVSATISSPQETAPKPQVTFADKKIKPIPKKKVK